MENHAHSHCKEKQNDRKVSQLQQKETPPWIKDLKTWKDDLLMDNISYDLLQSIWISLFNQYLHPLYITLSFILLVLSQSECSVRSSVCCSSVMQALNPLFCSHAPHAWIHLQVQSSVTLSNTHSRAVTKQMDTFFPRVLSWLHTLLWLLVL